MARLWLATLVALLCATPSAAAGGVGAERVIDARGVSAVTLPGGGGGGGASAAATGGKLVMPWMCLQRCNQTSAQVNENLRQVFQHSTVVRRVAFEMFNLGSKGDLVKNDLAHVAGALHGAGFETFAMVSSYPYPPAFLDWMRTLFADPKPFIKQCLQMAKEHKLSGFNVDFEPTVPGTAQDAQDFADFLGEFADALHAEGLQLTVDVGSWNPIWNWTLLGESGVDRVLLMSTYTGSWKIFQEMLARGVKEIGVDRLGVGLETVNPNTKQPFTAQELQERMTAIQAAGVQEIDLWRAPIPELWWPQIEAWYHA